MPNTTKLFNMHNIHKNDIFEDTINTSKTNHTKSDDTARMQMVLHPDLLKKQYSMMEEG